MVGTTASPQPAGGPSDLSPQAVSAHSGAHRAYWSQAEAIALCREVERLAPAHGCHVALTGGALYKDGPRKDLDLLFYRIRQVDEIDEEGLFDALAMLGIQRRSGFGWCIKAEFEGRKIDCFFPEELGGEYVRDEDENEPEFVPFPVENF